MGIYFHLLFNFFFCSGRINASDSSHNTKTLLNSNAEDFKKGLKPEEVNGGENRLSYKISIIQTETGKESTKLNYRSPQAKISSADILNPNLQFNIIEIPQ